MKASPKLLKYSKENREVIYKFLMMHTTTDKDYPTFYEDMAKYGFSKEEADEEFNEYFVALW